MSELPSLVRVKRKRSADPAPDLFLEDRSTKRSQTWQFRLQTPHPNSLTTPLPPPPFPIVPAQRHADTRAPPEEVQHVNTTAADKTAARREYRLAIDRTRLANASSNNHRKRKAQLEAHDIPTFIESRSSAKKARHFSSSLSSPSSADAAAGTTTATPQTTGFKRPSASAKEKAWRKDTWGKAETAGHWKAETWQREEGQREPEGQEPSPSQDLVDQLTAMADEEAAREEAEAARQQRQRQQQMLQDQQLQQQQEKPRVKSVPKMPVQRFRERNPEEFAARTAAASNGNANGQYDVEMDIDASDDDDYVYDTYVRTKEPVMLPSSVTGDGDNDNEQNSASFAYLVITEQDQPFWETYFEDEESDKEFDTDDEDENGKLRVPLHFLHFLLIKRHTTGNLAQERNNYVNLY